MTADRGRAGALRPATPRKSAFDVASSRLHLRHSCQPIAASSVPGAFYSAIDAGREARSGYARNMRMRSRYLLYTRPILGEQAVVSRQVHPTSIIDGTPLWLEGGALIEGLAVPNGSYIDADTVASSVVPDALLPNLLPPYAIASSEAGASGACHVLRSRHIGEQLLVERRDRLRHAMQRERRHRAARARHHQRLTLSLRPCRIPQAHSGRTRAPRPFRAPCVRSSRSGASISIHGRPGRS